MQAAASPQDHVAANQGIPPFLIVQRGDAARRAAQQKFYDTLVAAAVPVTMIDASALTHEEVNSSIGSESDQIITPPLMRFLTACL